MLKSICILSILFHAFFECHTNNLAVDRKLDVHEVETSTLKTPHRDEDRISKFHCPLNNTNSSSSNISDSNLTYDYTTVTPPVINLNKSHDWGGNCTDLHWENCCRVEQWGGISFTDKNNQTKKIAGNYTIDCQDTEELYRIMCLRNGWTVSRCNLLCMARCNRNLLKYWNRYVSHVGKCAQNEKSDAFMDLECQVEKLKLFKKLGCPSNQRECEKKNTDFILKQLGCQSANDTSDGISRANGQTISCWLLFGRLLYLVLIFLLP